MCKKRILFFLVMLWSVHSTGQDLHFSQYFRTPIFLNPALTGVQVNDIRVLGVFRNQWATIPVPYNSFGLSIDGKLPLKNSNNKFGLGTQILTDRAGDAKYTTTQVSLSGAYHLLGKNSSPFTLSAGTNITYYHRKYDPYQLTFDNQFNGDYFDPNLPINEQFDRLTLNFVDLGIGLNFSYAFPNRSSLRMGGSMQHIASTQQNFLLVSKNTLLQPKFNVYLDGKIRVSTSLSFVPMVFFQYQDKKHETVSGLGFEFDVLPNQPKPLFLMLGTSYRWGDAFIPWVQMEYEKFSAQFSYDLNTSPLRIASANYGGVELTLGLLIDFRKEKSKYENLHCPDIWF